VKRNIGILLLAVILLTMFTGCGFRVARPEIQKGEFAFSVTYEYNGEVKTVSGVYVCEYNGTAWVLDGGFHREWKGYVRGNQTNDRIELGTAAGGGKIELDFDFFPEYFMGDPAAGDREAPVPYISVMLISDEGMSMLYEPEEVEAACGAKIISYEYAAPIKNSFSR
jgi:hypothetical protein